MTEEARSYDAEPPVVRLPTERPRPERVKQEAYPALPER